jgi:hypothetical protein
MSIGIIVINIAEQPARLQQRSRRLFISLPVASAIEMCFAALLHPHKRAEMESNRPASPAND